MTITRISSWIQTLERVPLVRFPTTMLAFDLVWQPNTGEMPVVKLAWPVVDARDVAKAHVVALTHPTAKGRSVNHIICNTKVVDMRSY